MMSFDSQLRQWLLAAPFCVILSALILVAELYYGADFAWKKAEVLNGEYWRMVTGHWLHLNWMHWVMNVAGLMLILWIFPQLLVEGRWLIGFVVVGIGVSVGLLFSYLDGYVGMSGVLYGLVFYGCMLDREYSFKLKCLLLSIVVLKMLAEQTWPEINDSTADQIGGIVAIDGHMYGSISGFILGSLAWLNQRRKRIAAEPA